MSASFTNQVLAQIEPWQNGDNYDRQVYVLPKHLDEKVARLHLAKLGAKLTELSTDQADYLGIAQAGAISRSIIATSLPKPCRLRKSRYGGTQIYL